MIIWPIFVALFLAIVAVFISIKIENDNAKEKEKQKGLSELKKLDLEKRKQRLENEKK